MAENQTPWTPPTGAATYVDTSPDAPAGAVSWTPPAGQASFTDLTSAQTNIINQVRAHSAEELHAQDFRADQALAAVPAEAFSPDDIDKLTRITELHRNSPFNTGKAVVSALSAAPELVGSFVKGAAGVVKRGAQILNPDTAAPDREKATAELLASVESGSTGTAGLVRQGARKLGDLINGQPSHEESKNRLFEDAADIQQQQRITEAQGELAKAAGFDADTLAKQGIQVDPEAVSNMSSVTDLTNLIPFGAGFAAVSKGGKVIFTAATREAAEAFSKSLGEKLIATGKGVAEASKLLKKLPATNLGVATGLAAHSTGVGAGAAVAAKGIPIAGQLVGKAIEGSGKILIGEPGLAGRVVGAGVKGGAAGVAASLPFAASADYEEDAGRIAGGGALLGAAGGALHQAGHEGYKAGQDLAQSTATKAFQEATAAPPIQDTSTRTEPEWAEAHTQSMDRLRKVDPATANLIDRISTVLPAIEAASDSKPEKPAELYALDRAAYQKIFEGTPAEAQAGFYDEKNNRLVVRLDGSNAEALRHEPGHLIFELLPEQQRNEVFKTIEKAYGDAGISKFAKLYEDRFNQNLPAAQRRTFDPSDPSTRNYLLTELAVENLSNILRGDRLDGSAPSVMRVLGEKAANFFEKIGLYKPDIGGAPNKSTVTELRVGVSPAVREKLAPFFRGKVQGDRVAAALEAAKAPKWSPPAGEATFIDHPTLATPEPPKAPEAVTPPSTQQAPPPGLAVAPPNPEEFGGFGERPFTISKPDLATPPEATPAKPTVRGEEIPQEPKPANIRGVSDEKIQKLSTQRDDMNIAPAAEAVKNASSHEQEVFADILKALEGSTRGNTPLLEIVHNSITPTDEASPTNRAARREEQEAGRAAEQAGSIEERTATTKRLVPTGFSVTKEGRVQLFGESADKIVASVNDGLVKQATEKGVADKIPYENANGALTPEGESQFFQDLGTYTANQANGYRGDGKKLIRPVNYEGILPPENPDFKPTVLDTKRAQFLNLVIAGGELTYPKTTRVQTNKLTGAIIKPRNVAARELATANGGEILKPANPGPKDQTFKDFGGVEIAEFNPLRRELEKVGVDFRQRFVGAPEKVNLEDIQSVRALPGRALQAPSVDMVRAGFMPRTENVGTADEVRNMSHEELAAAARSWKGGLTGQAIELGKRITPDQLPVLENYRDEAHQKFGEYRAAHDLDKAMGEASRGQFFREAMEAHRASNGETGLSIRPEDTVPRAFMPDTRTVHREANEEVRKVADDYMQSVGKKYTPDTSYKPVNVEFAKRIADYYDAAKSDPKDPQVKASYQALADETMAQYAAMKKAGVEIEPWTGKGEPYANSAEMIADVAQNKHLWFFTTDNGFGESESRDSSNPMLAESGVKIDGHNLLVNDIFRAVHDYFGHVKEGNQFGPRGEFNAWRNHSEMFSDKAQGALAAETLAQNSWVNYGAHMRDKEGNIRSNVPLAERAFAEQKAVVIPKELIDEAKGSKPGGAAPDFAPRRSDAPATIDEFKDDHTIAKALTKPGWAIVTATQEALGAGTDKVNVEANKVLAEDLKKAGYNFTEVRGKYKGIDQGESFLVTGIEPDEALDLGKRFQQESVLTNDGLLYEDGTHNPVDPSSTFIGDLAKEQDFYSQVEGGPAFSLGIDFSTREPLAKEDLRFMPALTDTGKELEKRGYEIEHSGTRQDISAVTIRGKNGQEVGSITLTPKGRDAKEVAMVAVKRSQQGKGFGEALYREALTQLQNEGVKSLKGMVISPKPIGLREKLFGGVDKVTLHPPKGSPVPKQDISAADAKAILAASQQEDWTPEIHVENRIRKDLRFLPNAEPQFVAKKPLPNSVDEPVKVVHYSSRDLKKVDPKFFGKAFANRNDLRGGAKSFFFEAGSPLGGDEQFFGQGGRNAYGAVIDGSRLYDLSAGKPDPLGWTTKINREEADDAVKDAGYVGVRIDTGPDDGRKVVLMFKPVKVEPLGTTKPGDVALAFMPNTPVARAKAAAEKYPEALPIRYRRDEDGKIKMKDGFPVPQEYDYDLSKTPLAKAAAKGVKGDEAREKAITDAYASRLVDAYDEVKKNPEIMAGKTWYSDARTAIKSLVGDDAEFFAQLLAATSARTPVEDNFKQAVDAYNLWVSGAFEKQVEKYHEGLALNAQGKLQPKAAKALGVPVEDVTPERAERWWVDSNDLLPMKSNGTKFNANSFQVLRVLAGTWKDTVGGPKTPNFAGNLSGGSLEATIDVWAARLLRRMGYEGVEDKPWRILPENETGVTDPDFFLGQKAFRAAAEKLGMNPDDLQAVLWFAEKDHWEKNGWTNGAGAEKSDFNSFLRVTDKDNFGNLRIRTPQQEFGNFNFTDLRRSDRKPSLNNVKIQPAKKVGQKSEQTLQLGL